MNDINDILAKHFSGEANAEETQLVEEWKVQHAEEYAVMSEAWQTADKNLLEALEFKTFDHKAAWTKVDEKLVDEKEIKVIKMQFYKRVAAACAVLLVGFAGFWLLNHGPTFKNIANTDNAPKEISLPDGSTVWLAANSTLDYQEDFKNERNLVLDGEAFFEVARDEAHPFIISTKFGDIEVLGTAFNVNVTEKGTEVGVDHGRVAVSNENGTEELTVGEFAIATTEGVSEIATTDVNFDSWKTGDFDFDNMMLKDVVALLNKHYATKIELVSSDKGENEVLKGTFAEAPIEDIIDFIVLTCRVEAEYGDDLIRLK
ncbi:MAG: transmembrane sensor [Crocinitomix sp.]|jgi:transmembrane sensor